MPVCIIENCKHKGAEQPIENFSLNPYEYTGYSKLCKDCEEPARIKYNSKHGHKKEFLREKKLKDRSKNVVVCAGQTYDARKIYNATMRKCIKTLVYLRESKRQLKFYRELQQCNNE
jgi:hypothetical protein